MVPWNFSKFFINPKGEVIKYFPPEEQMETVLEYIDNQMSPPQEL
jgi:glutathione peroxidase-family protein